MLLLLNKCGRGDSNPHDVATASPSSWCVCQFRHFREYQLGGKTKVAARRYSGVAASDSAGASIGAGPSSPLRTEPGPCWPMIARTIAPTMNSVPSTVVARVSTVAPARAPNAAWLPLPPNGGSNIPTLPLLQKHHDEKQ